MSEGSTPTPPLSPGIGTPGDPPSGAGRTRRSRPPRAPGAYLRLPLWQRFAVSTVIAVALLVAMVIWVDGHNTNSPTLTNPAQAVQANRYAEILTQQDQAPRSVRLSAGVAPAAALERVLRQRLASQIAGGSIDGPVKLVRCAGRGSSDGRHAFSCDVSAGGVKYPFLGVVDTRARRITFCKHDVPPVPSDSVPVSSLCRV